MLDFRFRTNTLKQLNVTPHYNQNTMIFGRTIIIENRNASGWKCNYTQTLTETHQKCVWIFNDATLFGYLSVET